MGTALATIDGRRTFLRVTFRGLAALWIGVTIARILRDPYQGDIHLYWMALPYSTAAETGSLYAPPVMALFGLLHAIPWPIFYAIWTVLNVALVVAAIGPVLTAVLLWPSSPLWHQLASGNIQLVLALAIVAGFRYPQFWALSLLTKPTLGIGLLWFALRREWRFLALALGSTAVIAGVSGILAPQMWVEWLGAMSANAAYLGTNPAFSMAVWPLIVRLPVAAVIVALGVWRNAPWTVSVAAFVALPWPAAVTSWTMLIGALAALRLRSAPPAWIEAKRERRGNVEAPEPSCEPSTSPVARAGHG